MANRNCHGCFCCWSVQPEAAHTASPITFEFHTPPATETPWLRDVRRMRGEVFYDHGRRPSFIREDGEFDDADQFDSQSFHVVARVAGKVVGAIRHTVMLDPCSGMVASYISHGRMKELIGSRGVDPRRITETSRWAALREYRGEIGRKLAAASWAIGRWIGAEIIFIVAGTHDRQVIAIIRMGARTVPEMPLIRCAERDDELRLLAVHTDEIPASMLPHVNAMAQTLNLSGGTTFLTKA